MQTAALANDGYVVAWEGDFGSIRNVFCHRFDGAGRGTGATTQIVNRSNQTMLLRDIAVTDDGAFSILTQGSASSLISDPRL